MIDRMSSKLQTPLKFILLIGSLVYFTLILICSFGGMGDNFFSVVANTIISVLTLGALASIPLFLLLKKERIARIIFTLLSGYWLISRSRDLLSMAFNFDAKGDGLFNTISIFGFFYGLALASCFVLIILGYILKKDVFKTIVWFILAGAIVFAYVLGILMLIMYSNFDAGWTTYVNLIALYFIHPILIPVGCLYLKDKE